MLSPKLAWRKKHGVQTWNSPHCEDPWCAWLDSDSSEPGGVPNDLESCGFGATEDEAMGDLAVRRGFKLWNEEAGA